MKCRRQGGQLPRDDAGAGREAELPEPHARSWTGAPDGLDELTDRVGMSVRNVRFYTSRGLVPPPIRRGRSGFYSADHVARLELVQDLQSHGFTLSAIEKYVAGIPASATPADIALHRTMLAPWQAEPPVQLTRVRAGQARRPRAQRRRPRRADHARRRRAGRPRPLPGGCRPPLGRTRPARPRIPTRGREGGRRGVRRPRARDRRGALRRVQEARLAGVQGVRRAARTRCARWSSGSSRCPWPRS